MVKLNLNIHLGAIRCVQGLVVDTPPLRGTQPRCVPRG